uniref:Three finger peptide n=1 Tax=Heloderma suspectum cinctum TaxID=537493 RepID=C6EVH1_HELSC|nr:three finger peptide [Heloderma suspectum cinctum]
MNKFLLLSISILLCSVLAEAFICYRCRRYKTGYGCKSGGPPICITKPGQRCKTITSIKGNRKGFIRQGCTLPNEVCDSTQMSEKSGNVTTTCCDSHYCNKI